MTNQEAMQILTDMGLHEGGMENWLMGNAWFRFANVVQAAEREACAKLCEEMQRNGAWITKEEAAAAIRARGQKLCTQL